MTNVLIFGAGYSGSVIGEQLSSDGHSVFGTSRDAGRFDALSARGIQPLVFDGKSQSRQLRSALMDTTHLIISIAPPRQADGKSPVDPVLSSFDEEPLTSLAPNLRWICYLSTVGVYGDHAGAWIDEETPVSPRSERSVQRVLAENEWMEVARDANLPLAVFRLSGIYGPGRNALLNAKDGKSRRLVKEGQVFNRIHVADIASAAKLAHSMMAAGIFNITDNEPAPPQDVVVFAHSLIGVAPPPEIDFETADLSPMARSFYGENKRVSNARSRSELGLDYRYPDYRTALSDMWESGLYA